MAVIYLFDPQLACIGAFDAAALVHSEAVYQATAEFRTDLQLTSGFSFGFKCVDGKFRIFEIDEVDYRDNPGDLFVTGTDMAVRELTDIVVQDVRCMTMSASVALSHLFTETGAPWVLGSTITTDSLSSRHYYKPLWNAIVNLAERYGVRMIPYFEISDSNVITARKIDIVSAEPVYRGRMVESGDEASSVVVSVTGNPKTAIYGRGKGVESGTTDSGDPTYGPRLTFKDVVWSTASGDPVNKPLGQEWVGDPTALQAFGRNGHHRFGVQVFEDITDAEQLLQATWDYLQTVAFPSVSATAAIYDLEMVEGYSWAAVRVNDEIVIRPKLFPADVAAAIIKIDRDYVNPANTRLEISTTGVAVSASSLYAEQTRKIEENSLPANVLTRDSVIDTMVTRIMSSGTNMFTDPSCGALCFVSQDGTTAMMLTGAGWMIADEKIGENWQWRTAATGSGIVADEITAGTLQASLIKIFGSERFYWDAENIYITDGTPDSMALYDVTLTKTNGEFVETYLASTTVDRWSGSYYTIWDSTAAAPVSGTTYRVQCSSCNNAWSFNYYDGNTIETVSFSASDTVQSKTFTISGTSREGWILHVDATITGLTIYNYAHDDTDLNVVQDLGDIEITDGPGVLKYGASLGTYTVTVDSISSGTDVTLTYVNLTTSEETVIGEVTAGNYSASFTCMEPFDLMVRRAGSGGKQIRIGKYDGVNYGIAFTNDSGATWQSAIDFNGMHFTGDAVSLRTAGGYFDIRNGALQASASAVISFLSGSAFNVFAGSQVNFSTDNFLIKNAMGRKMLSVSSAEGKEGQIVLGEEGFPVNFAGGFILPVANGGTGYSFGQVHRVTSAPSSSLGANGDLAILYASADGAYSSFTPSFTENSYAESYQTKYGLARNWNVFGHDVGCWHVGNNNSYAYALYGSFTTPSTPSTITGDVTLNMTGYHYYNNAAGLVASICDANNILASGNFIFPPGRSSSVAGPVSCIISGVNLSANTTYYLILYDLSSVTSNTSRSFILENTITFPEYRGAAVCGLYIKSAGVWVTAFEANNE